MIFYKNPGHFENRLENRSGNNVGNQYRSITLHTDDGDRKVIEGFIRKRQADLQGQILT